SHSVYTAHLIPLTGHVRGIHERLTDPRRRAGLRSTVTADHDTHAMTAHPRVLDSGNL
ncbi:hypothetical protein KL920_005452, partial [Ogataea angusta]